MSIENMYNQQIKKEIREDKDKAFNRIINKGRFYKRSNPDKQLGKSSKGLRVIPQELLEMSVWDD